LLAVLALAVLTWALNQGGFSGGGRTGDADPASMPTVSVGDLPPEARTTLALIDEGGPFPYDRDGVVFENREGLLPDHDSGYYHEYTVPTPGASDRGARRIITGSSGERYWTDDHYRSFERIEG
jgi:ribonuclease T1